MYLRLNRTHPAGVFRRAVRDKKSGQVKRVLIFGDADPEDPAIKKQVDAGKAVLFGHETANLTGENLEAVQADVAKGALVEVDDRGKPVPPPDEPSEYDRGYADGLRAKTQGGKKKNDAQDADSD